MSNSKKLVILCCLALVFFAPGIAAYVFYHHTQWLGATKINKGELVTPPVELSFLHQKKWKLIYWSPEKCEESCKVGMDKLARIRLALGRRLYQVDAMLLENSQAPVLSGSFTQQLKEQDMIARRLSPQEAQVFKPWSSEPAIFIANPEGYLVLFYTAHADPKNIYQDLKHLLHTKEQS